MDGRPLRDRNYWESAVNSWRVSGHERLSFPVDGPSPSDQFAERHFTQLSDIRERFPRDCDDIGQLSRFKRAPEIRP